MTYYLPVLGSHLHCHPGGKTWSWTEIAYDGGNDDCDDVDGVDAILKEECIAAIVFKDLFFNFKPGFMQVSYYDSSYWSIWCSALACWACLLIDSQRFCAMILLF
mgnify:CR=1 FL=1